MRTKHRNTLPTAPRILSDGLITMLAGIAVAAWSPHATASPNAQCPAPAELAASATAPRWGGPLSEALPGLRWRSGTTQTSGTLAGRIVIVEFWTFDCINCRRTIPAMKALAARYASGDVVLLGIHTPELRHEYDPARVSQAIADEGIGYPVAQDNDYKAWDAFHNQYWPALYVLDGTGAVRYRHIGELHEGSAAWTTFLERVDALRAPKRP